MKISYQDGPAPRDPRAEIVDACHHMMGLHILLKIADERQLDELSASDIASVFRSVGEISLAAADAILESLDEAARGAPPQ